MIKHILFIGILLITLTGCLNSKAGSGARDEDANKKRAHIIIDALAHYHTDHQNYPQALTELVPTYLAEIPKTTFGEEFVYYSIIDGYSIQFDRGKCYYTSNLQRWDCSGY